MNKITGHNILCDAETNAKMEQIKDYLSGKEATAAEICRDCHCTINQLNTMIITMTYKYPNLYEGHQEGKGKGYCVYGMAQWF